MTWEVTPTSIGQSYLVGDYESDDYGLVVTLGAVEPNLWCTTHHSFVCHHTKRVKDFLA